MNLQQILQLQHFMFYHKMYDIL